MLAMSLETDLDTNTVLDPVSVKVGEKGRFVLPVQFREAIGIKVGDVVSLEVVNDELRISTFAGRLKRTRERLKKYATPGKLASDELVEARRLEARKEEQEYTALSRWREENAQAKG